MRHQGLAHPRHHSGRVTPTLSQPDSKDGHKSKKKGHQHTLTSIGGRRVIQPRTRGNRIRIVHYLTQHHNSPIGVSPYQLCDRRELWVWWCETRLVLL